MNAFTPVLSRRLPGLAAAAIVLAVAATPAAATTKIEYPEDSTCRSITAAKGCLFIGNIGPATVAETQSVYRRFARDKKIANPDITLNYLFKSDDSDFAGKLTGTSTGGSWSTPGYLVDFIAVKAANSFVLYQLPAAASSGLWSTIDIPHRGSNLKTVSHLAFFGITNPANAFGRPSAVPEPASWLLMLAGMGLVGFNMRHRRRPVSVAV